MKHFAVTPRERNLADIGAVALRHGFTRDDILGPGKHKPLMLARWECVVMFRRRGLSTPAIGRIMQRDHSTIVHALQRMALRELPGTAGTSAGLLC